jgi:hypothetical protein
MQKNMSDSSDMMKKYEKLASKGQQGIDNELGKGAETERERSTKRLPTGA